MFQVPGGWAAQRWGGQKTLALSFGLWSTASILTSTDARKINPIVFARIMVGVAQGLVIPSIHTVLSQVGDTLLTFQTVSLGSCRVTCILIVQLNTVQANQSD